MNAAFNNINTINAGAGTADSITGSNAMGAWTMAAANSYTTASAAARLGFSGFENIIGGSMEDTFSFGAGASIGATISGGAGIDTLDFSSLGSDVTVALTGLSVAVGYSGSVAGAANARFTGIDVINAAVAGADSLHGLDQDSGWSLGAANQYNPASGGVGLAFSGFETIGGGTGADTMSLDIKGISIWTINGANSGTVRARNMGLSFAGMENLVGGLGHDTFNFVSGGSVSGDVAGDVGSDRFIFSGGSVAGTVSGDIGSDVLDFSSLPAAMAISLADSDVAEGFSGSVTGGATVTYSGVDSIHGSSASAMDTMRGLNLDSRYVLQTVIVDDGPRPADTYFVAGTNQMLTLFDVDLYSGNNFADNFVVRRTYNGDLNGLGGKDIFEVAATVNGNIDGGADADTLLMMPGGYIMGQLSLGESAGDNDVLDVSNYDMPLTLVFDENGGQAYAADPANGGSAVAVIANDGSGGAASGAELGTSVRQGGASVSMYGAESVVGAAHDGESGTGTYLVVQPGGASPTDRYVGDLTINGDASAGGIALDLPDLRSFDGHVYIGGVGAPPFPADGSEGSVIPIAVPGVDPDAPETRSLIRSRRTIVAGDIEVGGSLALLGSSVTLGADIYAGVNAESGADAGSAVGSDGQLAVVATGLSQDEFSGNGQVITEIASGEKERVVAAGDALFIMGDTLRNAEATVVNLGSGGNLQFAHGGDNAVSFSSFSSFVGSEVREDVSSYISRQLDLTLTSIVLILFNPATAFTQASVTGVDTGLFESEISLFGILGKGVSMLLSLCEEVEGCAPPVQLEAIESLLQTARQRLAELENAKGPIGNVQGANGLLTVEELVRHYTRVVRHMEALRKEYIDIFGEGSRGSGGNGGSSPGAEVQQALRYGGMGTYAAG